MEELGSTILPRATLPISTSLVVTNASTIPATPSPNSQVRCFNTGAFKTTLSGCRPTLDHIKTFPHYRTIQAFLMGVKPVAPENPPVIIYINAATCAVEIACASAITEDMFSWQQVRATATDVVEDCKEIGHGGWSPLGRGIGWFVKVMAFAEELGELGGNGTEVGKVLEMGDSTGLVNVSVAERSLQS